MCVRMRVRVCACACACASLSSRYNVLAMYVVEVAGGDPCENDGGMWAGRL